MSLNIQIDLRESVGEIKGRILDRFALHLNSVFRRAASGVQRRVGEVCESLIQGREEYQSLLNGELLGELGVPDIQPRLRHILDTVKRSVTIESTPIMRQGDQLTGGMVVKMIPADYADILGLGDAAYVTDKGTNIQWLDWLLNEGARIIVIGYEAKLRLSPQEAARSRTGLGLMRKGTGWRVPPGFSGTPDDNFITRAFNGTRVEGLFLDIVKQEIVSRV